MGLAQEASLVWRIWLRCTFPPASRNHAAACRLAIYRAADKNNFENDAALSEWAVQTMARFVDAPRPRVKAV